MYIVKVINKIHYISMLKYFLYCNIFFRIIPVVSLASLEKLF